MIRGIQQDQIVFVSRKGGHLGKVGHFRRTKPSPTYLSSLGWVRSQLSPEWKMGRLMLRAIEGSHEVYVICQWLAFCEALDLWKRRPVLISHDWKFSDAESAYVTRSIWRTLPKLMTPNRNVKLERKSMIPLDYLLYSPDGGEGSFSEMEALTFRPTKFTTTTSPTLWSGTALTKIWNIQAGIVRSIKMTKGTYKGGIIIRFRPHSRQRIWFSLPEMVRKMSGGMDPNWAERWAKSQRAELRTYASFSLLKSIGFTSGRRPEKADVSWRKKFCKTLAISVWSQIRFSCAKNWGETIPGKTSVDMAVSNQMYGESELVLILERDGLLSVQPSGRPNRSPGRKRWRTLSRCGYFLLTENRFRTFSELKASDLNPWIQQPWNGSGESNFPTGDGTRFNLHAPFPDGTKIAYRDLILWFWHCG